jgi:DNA polymerase III subunit gamma/tau
LDLVVEDAAGTGVGPSEESGTGGLEPYQSLYRRYRPQRFSEVRGQEHVTRALLNSVREGRVAHAYLFSGPRGTGKTSTARILAMALNCEHPVDGEPDGTCASCLAIRNGSSLDVHELDAASNRTMDEMRDLLAGVPLGTTGRWKVYIIDEVHQLTPVASSALLKTLEEPPGHVIFVLATTDPQRVLPTIRSRTQHFEFHLIPSDVLAGLLGDINSRAGLGVAPEAIDLVVRRGHGSARDALSVLDQVAAAGVVDDEVGLVSAIVDAVADRDVGRVLVAVAESMSAGRDPRRLAVDLVDHLRNGFLATQARGLVLLSDDAVAEVAAQANRLGLATLVRAMEVIGQASTDMRDSVDPRVTLEVALVRVASPAADTQPAALLARIEQIERRLGDAGGVVGRASAPPAGSAGPRREADPAAGEAGAAGEDPGGGGAPRPGGGAPGPVAAPGRSGGEGPSAGKAPPRSGRPSLGAPPPTPRSSRRGAPPSPPPPDPASGSGDAAGRDQGAGSGDAGTPDPVAVAVAMPSRDELTLAWGDVILPGLPGRVRAYVQLGRFLESGSDGAVYALPDAGLLGRAETTRADFERALASHFGRSIPVRLVLDDVPSPAVGRVPTPDAGEDDQDPGDYVLSEMTDATAVVSPEQRLLQAFPGAEEVTP